MKHEHDGWLYFLPNGNLTFQTMDANRRNKHLNGWCEPEATRRVRIHNDAEYARALEAWR